MCIAAKCATAVLGCLLLAGCGHASKGSSSKGSSGSSSSEGQTFTSTAKTSGGSASGAETTSMTDETVSGKSSQDSDDGSNAATSGHAVMNPGAPAKQPPPK